MYVYLCVSIANVHTDFYRRPDCFLVVTSERCGKQSAEPGALPCSVGEDFCPPPEPQLWLQHSSLPQNRAGHSLLHPSAARVGAVRWSDALWWVRARAWIVPGPTSLD